MRGKLRATSGPVASLHDAPAFLFCKSFELTLTRPPSFAVRSFAANFDCGAGARPREERFAARDDVDQGEIVKADRAQVPASHQRMIVRSQREASRATSEMVA